MRRSFKQREPLGIFLKKMLVFGFFFSVLFIGIFEFLSRNFGIWFDENEVKCIPEYSVYFVIKDIAPEDLSVGDIVTFNTHSKIDYFNENTSFGKYIAATRDDVVEINAKGVFVNGDLVAEGLYLAGKMNIPEESLYRKVIINYGQYFVIGTGPNSYDSRYWGVINFDQVTGKAYPIL